MNLLKYHSNDAYFPLSVAILRTSSPPFNMNGGDEWGVRVPGNGEVCK